MPGKEQSFEDQAHSSRGVSGCDGGASGEPRHRGIAPSDFVPWILVILLLVWNAISLSKIAEQTEMLNAIYSNYQTYYTQLSNQISELRSSADDLAEDQNQLARYSW